MIRLIRGDEGISLHFDDLESSKKIAEELKKINSSERGKPVDLNLIDKSNSLTEERGCLIIFSAHPDFDRIKKWNMHNVLLVGARNLRQEEILFIHENNIRWMGLNELEINLSEASDAIMEFSLGEELYLVFDMASIDSHSGEPGGLTSRQAIYIISRMSMMKNLKMFELNVPEDIDEKIARLGARLLAEML